MRRKRGVVPSITEHKEGTSKPMNAAAKAIAEAALVAVGTADPTITPDRVRSALDALDGRQAAAANESTVDRIVSPAVAAQEMGLSKRTLIQYARRGIIKAAFGGAKGTRAVGYWQSSLRSAKERMERAAAK